MSGRHFPPEFYGTSKAERFNALGSQGRMCPICFRPDSLALARDGSGVLECGEIDTSFRAASGCAARFRVEGNDLVRIRTRALKRLTTEELDQSRGGSA